MELSKQQNNTKL